jgi:hypothetical protein
MKKAGPDQTPASRLVFVKPEQENPLCNVTGQKNLPSVAKISQV